MGFSAEQKTALRGRLPSRHIKSRRHGDIDLHYIEGWYALTVANQIFGHDGWNRQTLTLSCIHAKRADARFSVSYHAKVRIDVRAEGCSITREGSGFGHAIADNEGLAHEWAAKAAETDASKRALATFGRRFGLELSAGTRSRDPKRPSPQKDPDAKPILAATAGQHATGPASAN